jgi:hypothetical protein
VRVGKYAKVVKSSEVAARLSVQKVAFRELIFVSSCVVLLDNGVPEKKINEIMRVGISSSASWKTLKALRRGALWVNQLIDKLSKSGWGYSALMLFTLCNRRPFFVMLRPLITIGGKRIAQYARFAERPNDSELYFLERLTVSEHIPQFSCDFSFSICTYVQQVIGDSVS